MVVCACCGQIAIVIVRNRIFCNLGNRTLKGRASGRGGQDAHFARRSFFGRPVVVELRRDQFGRKNGVGRSALSWRCGGSPTYVRSSSCLAAPSRPGQRPGRWKERAARLVFPPSPARSSRFRRRPAHWPQPSRQVFGPTKKGYQRGQSLCCDGARCVGSGDVGGLPSQCFCAHELHHNATMCPSHRK